MITDMSNVMLDPYLVGHVHVSVVICPFLCYTFMFVVIRRLLCHVVVIRLNHAVCTTVHTRISVDWLYVRENLLCGLGLS